MLLKISAIRTDGGTQVRVKDNPETVEDYARILQEGGSLPHPIVFYDGTDHWLADGFRRLAAHKKIGNSEIEVDRKNGTRRDAILYGISANLKHGERLTNADKRNSVQKLLADEEWRNWTNGEIAKRCGVHQETARAMRISFTTANYSNTVVGECETSTEVDSGEQPVTPSTLKYERNGQVRERSSPAAKRAKRGGKSNGPKNGQILFDWKSFQKHYGALIKAVDKAGIPFKANNSEMADNLRYQLFKWRESFRLWWSAISNMEPPQDTTSHVFSEAK